ncbi:unnamed protein product [Prunus brigantina]
MAHKGLMGLPLSPFTSSRIIGLQPALQPSAFGIGLQPLQPSASAFGPQPSAFSLQPMCNRVLTFIILLLIFKLV